MRVVTPLSSETRGSSARRRARAALLPAAALTAAFLTPAAFANASVAAPASPTSGTSTASAPAAVTDPAALVDPFVGTGSGGAVVGQVDTFPGADMPFGMIQWSPDTTTRPDGGGYNFDDSSITGFSLTHLSGPGCSIAGDFPILPVTGALPADPDSETASFSHSWESAHPRSYAVTAGGVHTQLAVTDRTGVAQFTYPSTSQAQLLVKVADSANGSSAATFQTVGDHEITGAVSSGHFCGQPDNYTVYFAAKFNRSFTASGTWGGTSTADVTRSAGRTGVSEHAKSGVVAGGWLTFDTTKERNVGMQVAVSYVSTAGALGNLAAEAHTYNVGAVAAKATAAWNKQLSTISIRGGSPTAQAPFYTALYHASLEPSLFNDANGEYLGFDNK